jgi:hypothetical protein
MEYKLNKTIKNCTARKNKQLTLIVKPTSDSTKHTDKGHSEHTEQNFRKKR